MCYGDLHPLAFRYPRYGLLPGGWGANREHSSLISKGIGLLGTGVTRVTSLDGMSEIRLKWLRCAGPWR